MLVKLNLSKKFRQELPTGLLKDYEEFFSTFCEPVSDSEESNDVETHDLFIFKGNSETVQISNEILLLNGKPLKEDFYPVTNALIVNKHFSKVLDLREVEDLPYGPRELCLTDNGLIGIEGNTVVHMENPFSNNSEWVTTDIFKDKLLTGTWDTTRHNIFSVYGLVVLHTTITRLGIKEYYKNILTIRDNTLVLSEINSSKYDRLKIAHEYLNKGKQSEACDFFMEVTL